MYILARFEKMIDDAKETTDTDLVDVCSLSVDMRYVREAVDELTSLRKTIDGLNKRIESMKAEQVESEQRVSMRKVEYNRLEDKLRASEKRVDRLIDCLPVPGK